MHYSLVEIWEEQYFLSKTYLGIEPKIKAIIVPNGDILI